LEFDLERGERGSRQDHTRRLLREITGADDGMVVTNAAAAVLLLLNSLADGCETIVSRGELVEIGGAFRIPEILAKSGSILVEVGTTNRTRRKDYELAISPRTRLLLKVHQSNFAVTGFVEDTPLDELVELGRPRGIPAVHDIGSGLLIDLSRWGLVDEPRVQHSVAAGATVVFSGDKLMGGPHGPSDIIQRAAANPLARVLRPDKFTIAALEATLSLYRDTDLAIMEIPTLAMLTADSALLEERARSLAAALPHASTRAGHSAVGGGTFPGARLPTVLVTLPTSSATATIDRLRRHSPPVIARAGEGAVLFDVRTILDEEITTVVAAVAATSTL
jgi:L-seryl-tRNA(Ser) seleniumtransferase